MQTKIEKKAIEKRIGYDVANESATYGPKSYETNGYSPNNQYDQYGGSAVKGNDKSGSISDHLNPNFDITKGGSKSDVEARERQTSYSIDNVEFYSKDKPYDWESIDTSLSGQVVIY